MGKRNKTVPLDAPLEAWVPQVMVDVPCSAQEAREVLRGLVRLGLVAVVDGKVTLPLSGRGRRGRSRAH